MRFCRILALVCFAEIAIGLKIKTAFSNEKELKEEQKFLSAVVLTTRPTLAIPSILQPSTTPKQYVETEKGNEYNRLVVGVVVENYSRYKLQDARTSGKGNCQYNRDVSVDVYVVYILVKSYHQLFYT
jgi:hypothetical protein